MLYSEFIKAGDLPAAPAQIADVELLALMVGEDVRRMSLPDLRALLLDAAALTGAATAETAEPGSVGAHVANAEFVAGAVGSAVSQALASVAETYARRDGANIGAYGRRNLLINGAFAVWSRGTSTTSGYLADRMRVSASATVAPTWDRVADVPAGQGFLHALRVTATPSTTILRVQHRLEARDALKCSGTVTVSAWVKRAVGTTMTIGFFKPGAAEDFSTFTQLVISDNLPVVAGEWTRVSWTTTLAAADLGLGIEARLQWAPVSGEATIVTGLQLERGQLATPFEHRSYAEDLVLCRRYFDVYGGAIRMTKARESDRYRAAVFQFRGPMRGIPVVTLTGATTGGGTGVAALSDYTTVVGASVEFWVIPTLDSANPVINSFTIDAEL